MRIVSLLPSATELIAALGFADRLVGRSHECDWPRGVADLPVLTAPKMNPQAEAAIIDRDVRQLVEQGLSVYRVNAELLKALQPDVVVTQSQCEVCAVSLSEVEQAVADWQGGTRPLLVSLEPMSLADIGEDILRLGAALDCSARAEALLADWRDGFAALAAQTARLTRRNVFFMEWTQPLMGAGNWIPEILQAGGANVLLGANGGHSPVIDWAQLHAAAADYIMVAPCGFGLARVAAELAPLQARPDWQDLLAVQNRQVYMFDGNQYFNRPGPRLLDAAQMTAEILHPDHFPQRHEGQAWQKCAPGPV